MIEDAQKFCCEASRFQCKPTNYNSGPPWPVRCGCMHPCVKAHAASDHLQCLEVLILMVVLLSVCRLMKLQ